MTAGSRSYGVVPIETLKAQSGIEFLTGIIEGRHPDPPICETLGFHLVEVDQGRAVFEGVPAWRHYNPIGSVHGGFAATLLDSCMGCAVHSLLERGTGYATLEFKVSLVRAVTDRTGPVRAEGRALSSGKRTATAEGRLVDASGALLAHGTTTCLVFSL
jgi:uncharacterized protein (TIGR00369 family)